RDPAVHRGLALLGPYGRARAGPVAADRAGGVGALGPDRGGARGAADGGDRGAVLRGRRPVVGGRRGRQRGRHRVRGAPPARSDARGPRHRALPAGDVRARGTAAGPPTVARIGRADGVAARGHGAGGGRTDRCDGRPTGAGYRGVEGRVAGGGGDVGGGRGGSVAG